MTLLPFVKRERGQILPMVAIMAVVLIAIIGLAIDVGRIMVAKAQLVRAVDAAALAGALKLPNLDAARDEVLAYMAENEPDADVGVPSSPAEREVEVVATKDVDLTFMSVLTLIPGIELDDPVTVTADAIAGFGVQHIDAHLDIDATYSMGDGCNWSDSNPGCPIKEAKDAAASFADTLMNDSPGSPETQMGVGAFRGCYNPPFKNSSNSMPWCVPVNTMVRDLTQDKSQVMTTIDQIDSDGFTNVCLGILKGQQILFGPNGQIVENGENLMKILVVLSDGDNNYDKSTYSSTYNSPDPLCRPNTSPWNSDPNSLSDNCLAAQTREKELDTKTKTLANELKSQGTEIYVVGFGVCDTNDPDQKPTAEYCSGIGNNDHDDIADRRLLKCIASSTPGTNDHYFEVPNAEDLPDVFGKIAQSIAFRLIK